MVNPNISFFRSPVATANTIAGRSRLAADASTASYSDRLKKRVRGRAPFSVRLLGAVTGFASNHPHIKEALWKQHRLRLLERVGKSADMLPLRPETNPEYYDDPSE